MQIPQSLLDDPDISAAIRQFPLVVPVDFSKLTHAARAEFWDDLAITNQNNVCNCMTATWHGQRALVLHSGSMLWFLFRPEHGNLAVAFRLAHGNTVAS